MTHPDKYPLLSRIDTPADLRKLKLRELPQLCRELRADILDELSQNPGHLASSLGTVELTVALHYVFGTPHDRIVWDVGHQAYGHKILTGRRDTFHTNRCWGGVRPFPSPSESEYDTFACGHASNSISAALGMSVATMQRGETDKHVVAVIGDGAMSGGLAFEGLNNVSETPNNLLIILNDNDMSISNSVGGMKRYLLNLHTSSAYNGLRNRLARRLESWGWLPPSRRKRLIRLNNAFKSFLSDEQNIFEGLNIRYFGPYDGHDVISLVRLLRALRPMTGPRLLHIKTVKGKGYDCAESDPVVWHAPGKFDAAAGVRLVSGETGDAPPKFQDVFGETLVELARTNERIVGVTPAMLTGCSMHLLQRVMPERTFDVGIAEGHAVTFSAGMAKEGMVPFCNIYSAFAQRAYDNIIHDTALLNLQVVFCLDRAGLVGEDGPTHHGAFDIAALRTVPNLTLASPMDECELRRLMYTAQLPGGGPFVIRYPRGAGHRSDWRCPLEAVEIGRGRLLRKGDGALAVLTFGPLGVEVADLISQLAVELPAASGAPDFEGEAPADGRITHVDLRFAKPLDETLLINIARTHRRLIVIEDASREGGIGSAVLELLADHGIQVPVERFGLPDRFIEHGSVAEQRKDCAMDGESFARAFRAALAEPAAPTV
ncbi:MAG: 1-deoxy-D-xylulose-5-phosphate synthase [Prevotellaceae bacterium]|nr:1-deoxy-D-xylulose-5-phosphate synthase [Prevotellaceae bacterium]